MADYDSTIQALPALINPALEDFLLGVDSSDSFEPKKLGLDKLMKLILEGNSVFTADSSFTLKANLDANGHKLINLHSAAQDNDAVALHQVKPMIQSLSELVPSGLTASDRGAFIRVMCSTINAPWGGFYMFYWCLDDSPSTSIDQVGADIVASSSAIVNFDGSVANVVNVPKAEAWQGKYFHYAVRYRNMVSMSPLSATGHILVQSPSYSDIISDNKPDAPSNQSLVVNQNRIIVTADPPPYAAIGLLYRFEILMNNSHDTNIQGNEEGLITAISRSPRFAYDLPLGQGHHSYVHARITCLSLMNKSSDASTIHCPVNLDVNLFNENYLNYLAIKMAEKIQTQDGQPLAAK
jgi:hypothetical protein